MTAADRTCLQVVLDLPLPRRFDYLAPPGQTAGADWLGCRVRVPFGKQIRIGVVVGVEQALPSGAFDLKPVQERLDFLPILSAQALDDLRWLAGYAGAALGETVFTALPAPLRAGQPLPDPVQTVWALSELGIATLGGMRAGAPQRLALSLVQGACDEASLDQRFDDWRAAMRSLHKRGLVEKLRVAPTSTLLKTTPRALTEEQRAALEALRSTPGFSVALLDGVTGSGKTEVYIERIRDVVTQGKQALVLVPEIGLTPQTLRRFEQALGLRVHALHSNLSDGERLHAWAAMASGQVQVAIGTRSAVFAPLPNPGLLIVDEEHDASYKQQDGIRYHARDFAIYRARQLGVPIVLGSATPSLESLHHAWNGRYRHLRLIERANARPLPQVRVVDVRKRPMEAGLGTEALQAITDCLQRGEQALVFKNRRGYAPVLLCHDCGWSARCTHCDAPMTWHAQHKKLMCHHCGLQARAPHACPSCDSLALQPQGVGTERLEEVLAARFPDATLVRVDRDSTRQRDGVRRQLEKLGDASGIFVGTQMLAKGHDLPNLSLVVVVGVDEGLFSADFRAGERLAQLLVQVSGRAGRAQLPGQVLLQTHHPEHPLLQTLLARGYHGVAAAELAQREQVGFPPFAHLALLRAEAKSMDAAMAFLRAADALLAEADAAHATPAERHGPLPAPMPRRAGLHRAQLLLQCRQRPQRQRLLESVLPRLHALPQARKLRWSVDVDPVDLY